jgi:hypothetical protein
MKKDTAVITPGKAFDPELTETLAALHQKDWDVILVYPARPDAESKGMIFIKEGTKPHPTGALQTLRDMLDTWNEPPTD